MTVHMAIAGIFFLTAEHKRVHFVSLVFLIAGYAAFSWINYNAKEIEYALLSAVTQQISEIDTNFQHIDKYFDELSFSDRSTINSTVHWFSALAICVVGYFSGITCYWSARTN